MESPLCGLVFPVSLRTWDILWRPVIGYWWWQKSIPASAHFSVSCNIQLSKQTSQSQDYSDHSHVMLIPTSSHSIQIPYFFCFRALTTICNISELFDYSLSAPLHKNVPWSGGTFLLYSIPRTQNTVWQRAGAQYLFSAEADLL